MMQEPLTDLQIVGPTSISFTRLSFFMLKFIFQVELEVIRNLNFLAQSCHLVNSNNLVYVSSLGGKEFWIKILNPTRISSLLSKV